MVSGDKYNLVSYQDLCDSNSQSMASGSTRSGNNTTRWLTMHLFQLSLGSFLRVHNQGSGVLGGPKGAINPWWEGYKILPCPAGLCPCNSVLGIFATPILDLLALIPSYCLDPDSVAEPLACISGSEFLTFSCLTSALASLPPALPPALFLPLFPMSCFCLGPQYLASSCLGLQSSLLSTRLNTQHDISDLDWHLG